MATQFPAMKLLAVLLFFGLIGAVAANPTGLFAASTETTLSLTATQNDFEGSPTTFTLQFTDRNPSPLERYNIYNPYEVQWNWGDGSLEFEKIIPDSRPFQTTITKQHVYVQDRASYRATASVKDYTTGAIARTITTTKVLNAKPVASLDVEHTYGGQWALKGSWTDPGIGDTHIYFFDFGDGQLTGAESGAALERNGAGSVTKFHTYEGGAGDWTSSPCSDNPEIKYLVKFAVQDSNGAAASASKEITVSGAPPSYEKRLVWVRDQVASLTLEKREHQKHIVESLDNAILHGSTGPGLPVAEPADSPQHNYVKSFDRVRKAVHHIRKLTSADNSGYLCALNNGVRDKAKERLDLAIQQVGLENKDVAKAQQKYNEGLELLLAGKFNEAINKFKESLSKATRAISKDVLFSYSDELDFSVGDVEGLLGTDARADKELNKIIDEIGKAGQLADRDKFQEATQQVQQVLDDLQRVQKKFGIDASQVTTDMVLDIELAASLKLLEAQQIITGPEINSAKAGQLLAEGDALREAGDYQKAVDRFQQSYQKSAQAIKEGGKPARPV